MNRTEMRRRLTELASIGFVAPDEDLTALLEYASVMQKALRNDGYVLLDLRRAIGGRLEAIVRHRDGRLGLAIARLPNSLEAANSLVRIWRALEAVDHDSFGRVQLRHFAKNPEPSYLVTDYFDAAEPITSMIATDAALNVGPVLIDVIYQVLNLHDAGVFHGDINPRNILVSSAGTVHLTDFEFAISEALEVRHIEIAGTHGYMHPDLLEAAIRLHDGGRRPAVEELRAWDYYSLSRTILNLIDIFPAKLEPWSALYSYRFLSLLAHRLQGGSRADESSALGIPAEWFAQISLTNGAAIRDVIDRLRMPEYFTSRIPELDAYSRDQIAASPFVKTVNSKRLQRTLASPELTRLSNVQQLGLLSTIFPTATHTRLAHAIGVYGFVCEYLRYAMSDPANPFMRQVVDPDDVKATILAALLHDIGHFPLAHDLEEAADSVFDHERRTMSLLDDPSDQLQSAVEGPEPVGWGLPISRVVSILDPGSSVVKKLLHSFISGPLDADKLDYLTRDSTTLGVPYGERIDIRFLLTELTPILAPHGRRDEAYIGTSEKGSTAAAAVADARFRMYARVYWHHTYREVKAMIQSAIGSALAANALRQLGVASPTISDLSAIADVEPATLRRAENDMNGVLDGFLRPPAQSSGALFAARPAALARASWEIRPEHEILLALTEDGMSESRRLAEAVVERSYYKRIHSISVGWSLDEEMLGQLKKLLSEAKRAWMARLLLSAAFQRRTLERIVGLRRPETRTTTVFSLGDRDRLLADGRKELLLLVDFQDMTKSPSKELWFVQEESKLEGRVAPSAALRYRKSHDYDSVHNRFNELWKVRVMASPRFATQFRMLLSDSSIEEDVRGALHDARSLAGRRH